MAIEQTLPGLDLRSLFRDAQARAARLKLLIEVSRELAAADTETLDRVVGSAARKAAHFAGFRQGRLEDADSTTAPDEMVIPLESLAERGRSGVRLVFSAPTNPQTLSNDEDAAALRLLVEMIEARLTVDLQRRKETQLVARLAARETELELVLSSVVKAQERERAAIAADLHDGVAQQVAALYRHMELLHLELAPIDTAAADRLQALIAVARRSVSDLRGVIAGLRPPSLDDLGVTAALREEARRLEGAGHRVAISDHVDTRLPDWLETLLFRIGQEAFNNASKHAPGGDVALDLSIASDRSRIILTVDTSGVSDGRLDDLDDGPHFGLDIMRERLAEVAGLLSAGPTSNGFRIRATVPLAGV
ncbi:MAG: hypothetical protein JHC81_05395 [Brevundimonas sp.]|uniref:sensor histidine kinase n=1 Tax=Brevundimonas sp. TaxID=1871086 RepID=UPI001A1F4170|nr:histidine kinase [Brevundimonas sp.]MBJ7446950.1 hypothetical protein [Brevundimonas sp.]